MNLFKRTMLVSTLAVLPTISSAWVVERNFEDAKSPVGTLLHQDDAQYFQDFGNRRVYVSDKGYSGSKSLEMRIDKPYINSKTASTVWAAGIGLSTGEAGYSPKEGDEVWSRVRIYFSPNWSWAPAKGSALKIVRVFPSSYYSGELIVGVAGNGIVRASTQNYTGGNIELYAGTSGDASGPSVSYPVGRWFTLETYMKISSNPNVARIKIFLDGKLVFNRGGNDYGFKNRQTLNRVNSNIIMKGPGVVLFSTWDVDASQSGPILPNGAQFARYDNILVTNEKSRATVPDGTGGFRLGN